ncbi:hypothetical protein ZEAMMB73_Zm00001d051151 [Zea mays]|uniref:Uncharacterized protein n=1 Tax=Zea mays TaxID=4577 RepID=A0A1D6Q5A2_MAIZE|nr:hypothetical protein ZEAMMB73_Zm00001d051151 [Zea mays]AQK53720.1 hypothetical protein ZEAMMB73_Zm00001d051151 [Zea mays]
MSKLSTSISQSNILENEGQYLQYFESPPKRAWHKSVQFSFEENEPDNEKCMI